MAANFESGVTFGERSWHGLETNLPADHPARFSVEQTIEHAGMNWNVEKYPLAIAPSVGDLAGTVASEVFGVFRQDTMDCLGSVGPDYKCLQNAEIFQQFQPFLDCKALSFESAGALDSGKRVYVQARLAMEDIDIGGGDTVAPYLLIASSHDGSLSTNVGFTPQRVVCWNTLSMALGSGKSRLLKVKHTRGQQDALKLIMETVDVARMEFVANCDQYRRLLLCKISEKDLAKYVKQVIGIADDAETKDISTRTYNQYDKIMHLALYGKGQSGVNDLTLWSAYNGVTEWTSHYRQSTAEARQKSVWFGASQATNAKALSLALSLAV